MLVLSIGASRLVSHVGGRARTPSTVPAPPDWPPMEKDSRLESRLEQPFGWAVCASWSHARATTDLGRGQRRRAEPRAPQRSPSPPSRERGRWRRPG